MTKKRLKKVYKPMAYLFIGCFLIYILLSQAMSVFSRTAEIDKLEKTKLNVKEFSKREEAYAVFALIAFLSILLEILLRNTVLKKIP